MTVDEEIKGTFDMLVERISNLEDIVQSLHRGAVLAECCKYGRLNNATLGHPFSIHRRQQWASSTSKPQPTMEGVIVTLPTIGDCTCSPPRNYSQKRIADRYLSDVEACGRFKHKGDDAIQLCVGNAFENTEFGCYLLESGGSGMTLSISHKDPGTDAQLSTFINQIPRVRRALGHGVGCIRSVQVSSICNERLEMALQIQLARHLPRGPLKEQIVQKLERYGLYDGMATTDGAFPDLAAESALVRIHDVERFLKLLRLEMDHYEPEDPNLE